MMTPVSVKRNGTAAVRWNAVPEVDAFDPGAVEVFRCTGFEIDEATSTLRLGYALDDLELTEVLTLPPGGLATAADERLARLLWLAAAPSYYKAAAPGTVVVEQPIADDERAFLAALLGPGLGEFSFTNDLDPSPPRIEGPTTVRSAQAPLSLSRRALVPVGGGKDSCVTLQALHDAGESPLAGTVRSFPVIDAVVERSGADRLLVGRTLDPLLGRLNALGARNGHVPVTATVSLAMCLAALRAGCDAVVMSDERSASEANFDWRGAAINHQWSKSLAAEEQIAALVTSATGGSLDWFSILRPFSELAICRLFAERSHRYFRVFSSCNAAFRLDPAKRIDGWDRSCPKCRFVALALAPWLDRDEVVRIQGGDVLDDPTQVEGLLALIAADSAKPFECVGEVAESRVAVRLAMESEHGWNGARALIDVADRLRTDGAWPTAEAIDDALDPDLALTHLVPDTYRPVVEDLAGAAAAR
jgi:hypothetical protein